MKIGYPQIRADERRSWNLGSRITFLNVSLNLTATLSGILPIDVPRSMFLLRPVPPRLRVRSYVVHLLRVRNHVVQVPGRAGGSSPFNQVNLH